MPTALRVLATTRAWRIGVAIALDDFARFRRCNTSPLR